MSSCTAGRDFYGKIQYDTWLLLLPASWSSGSQHAGKSRMSGPLERCSAGWGKMQTSLASVMELMWLRNCWMLGLILPLSLCFLATQTLSSFLKTCPYHLSLCHCTTVIISYIPGLSLNSPHVTLTPHVHLIVLISAHWSAISSSFFTVSPESLPHCLPEEMTANQLWLVCPWRAANDI